MTQFFPFQVWEMGILASDAPVYLLLFLSSLTPIEPLPTFRLEFPALTLLYSGFVSLGHGQLSH